MKPYFPVRLLIKRPDGLHLLTPQEAQIPLPYDPNTGPSPLTYGGYLKGVFHFLSQNDYAPLMDAVTRHLGRAASLEAIRGIDIISEKHGAIYNVARAAVQLAETRVSFAVNAAMGEKQQAFFEREFQVLNSLHELFKLPFLPKPYAKGETFCTHEGSAGITLKMFMTEWFEGCHEFHWSQAGNGKEFGVKVWDLDDGDRFLNEDEILALYEKMAAVLTAYLNTETFEQIYPWHHGAGDFVLCGKNESIDVRMVTARDYRCITELGTSPEERWFALMHFFFNLTIRMRLDRLDGTGEYAWAPSHCLGGVVRGFLKSWNEKASRNSSLPPSPEVAEFLSHFTFSQWRSFTASIVEEGKVEEEETSFIMDRLDEHITSLIAVLGEIIQ
jgi:hypothetical protein